MPKAVAVSFVRSLLRHPVIVAGLLCCALLVRMLVPAGYMPVVGGGGMRLELCSGTMPVAATTHATMVGMHHDDGRHDPPAKAEQPCTFAGLAAPALGAADPVLLAAALVFAFVVALFGARRLPLLPRVRLRPPLRAPPLPA